MNSNCVSIISRNGEKKSFGTRGSGPGEFRGPEGVVIDTGGNILVADISQPSYSAVVIHWKTS